MRTVEEYSTEGKYNVFVSQTDEDGQPVTEQVNDYPMSWTRAISMVVHYMLAGYSAYKERAGE